MRNEPIFRRLVFPIVTITHSVDESDVAYIESMTGLSMPT